MRVAIRTGDTPQRDAPGDAARAARRPDHHAGVPLPDAHLARAGDAGGRRVGDRRRDPRGGRRPSAARTWRSRSSGSTTPPDGRCSASGCPPRSGRSRRWAASWSARGASARIVDTGMRKQLDLEIHVPVEDMKEPDADALDLDPLGQGDAATRRSIWPAIYPELLELVRAHRSTIVFVNNRRGAERLAARLNEMAESEIARAHHGSLAREERLDRRGDAEVGRAALPRGHLLARARHRHGRGRPGAAGGVAQVGHARPAAHRARRPRGGRGLEGPHLPQVPRRPARVRGRGAAHARGPDRGDRGPAQPARRAGAADRGDHRRRRGVERAPSCTSWCGAPTPTPSSRASCSTTCSTCSTAAIRRRTSASCGRASSGTASPTPCAPARARCQLAVTNAGTIPDRGLFGVHLPDGRRVGELDEEMVYEARPGRRSCSAPRPGASRRSRATACSSRRRPARRARCRSGRATAWAGRPSSAARSASSRAGRSTASRDELAKRLRPRRPRRQEPRRLPARAARGYTRVVPSDRTIVVERFRDEIGDWRLCVLSPYGGRVHAAWALALSARIRDAVRARVGRDLVGRRHHRAPPRRRRAARAPSSCWSSPTSSRTWSCASSAPRPCSARASARTPRARC